MYTTHVGIVKNGIWKRRQKMSREKNVKVKWSKGIGSFEKVFHIFNKCLVTYRVQDFYIDFILLLLPVMTRNKNMFSIIVWSRTWANKYENINTYRVLQVLWYSNVRKYIVSLYSVKFNTLFYKKKYYWLNREICFLL